MTVLSYPYATHHDSSRGFKDASRPGTVLMARINFGLAAILAKLGAEADWPTLLTTD